MGYHWSVRNEGRKYRRLTLSDKNWGEWERSRLPRLLAPLVAVWGRDPASDLNPQNIDLVKLLAIFGRGSLCMRQCQKGVEKAGGGGNRNAYGERGIICQTVEHVCGSTRRVACNVSPSLVSKARSTDTAGLYEANGARQRPEWW